MEPVLKIYSGLKKANEKIIVPDILKDREEESLKRLEAYVSWCIWNDCLFCEQIVNPQNLNVVWDAKPAEQIYRDSKRLDVYEAIYGQLKMEMDERELKKGRLRQQDEGQHRLHHLLRTWLDHPNLKPWHEKLKKNKFMTFFTLVGETKTSVKKSLDGFDSSFGYPVYSEGSMAIHGSSVDQFLHFGNKNVMPLFIAGDDKITEKAEEVGSNCNQVIILLYILIKLLWPQQLQSNP
jgi:hypothetical protein